MPNMSPTKVPMPQQDPNVRNKNFEEVATGYTAEMAMEEATRCINCKNRPCMTGCPVNVPIPGFIEQVAAGNSRKHTRSLQVRMHFRQSVDVSAHRRISARVSVSVVSRVSLYPSDVWSVSWQITTWHTVQRQN